MQLFDFVHVSKFFGEFEHGSSPLALGQRSGRHAFCCYHCLGVGLSVHLLGTVALDVSRLVAHKAPAFLSLHGLRVVEWWECHSDCQWGNDGPQFYLVLCVFLVYDRR